MKNDTNERIKSLHKMVKELLDRGLEYDQIAREMEKEGIDPAYARLIIENVKTDYLNRVDAWKLAGMGLFFIIGGIYINYFSYRISLNANSPFFYLFWGIVVAGVLLLIRAYSLFKR